MVIQAIKRFFGSEPKSLGSVLLVDGVAASRELMVLRLQGLKLKVAQAKDAQSALKLLDRGNSFDFFAIDMETAGMGGVELAQEIRKLRNGRGKPVLFLSQKRTEEELQLLKENFAGCSCLRKPIDPRKFLVAVDDIFPGLEKKPSASCRVGRASINV